MPPLTRLAVEPGGASDPAAWYRAVPAVAQLRAEGLDLDSGVTVLVGENGAGKSTLVEALAAAWRRRLTAQVRHWSPIAAAEDADLGRWLRLDGEGPPPQGALAAARGRARGPGAGAGRGRDRGPGLGRARPGPGLARVPGRAAAVAAAPERVASRP